uniref:Serine/arginine repetitive matrix protein 2 n=1 Tax=Rhizophora mucronata TaxID=61149 RepID=A0A2P2JTR3_RHIMU
MTKEMQPLHDMTASNIGATKDGDSACKRKGYGNDAPQHVSNEDGLLVNSGINKFTSSRDFTAELLIQERTGDCNAFASKNYLGPMESNQTLVAAKTVADTAILKSCSEASQDIFSLKDSAIQQSQSNLSVPVLEDAENPFQRTADSCMLNSSADKISRTFQKMFCASDTVQSMAASVHNPFQQPSRDSSCPPAESLNTAHKIHSTKDHNLMPPLAAVQSLPASTERFPSYMLPNRNTLFAGIPNSSWTALPTQPPVLPPHDQNTNAGTAPVVASLPPRIDFGSQKHPRPYLNELQGHSQVYDSQWQLHPPELESHQPVLHGEDVSFKPLPRCNPFTQQSGLPSLFREDQSTKIPLQGSGSLDSSTQGSSYGQPIPFLQESPAIKLQPFPGNSSPDEMLKSSSQNHPYLQQQQQQPPYFLHQPLSDSVDGLPGRITSSRNPPDLLDRDQPSQPLDPYAPTFEHPISSRFSSDISRPEKVSSHKFDPPSNLVCASIDGQDVDSVGSRRATSSSDSPKVIGQIPRSGGDQYDPLFDSIEPSSNLYQKFDNVQEREPNNDSDNMLRISGSNRPPDVEETNKKEVGGINLAISVDNEECGETTDVEVGDIENASQGNLNTTANIDMVEMEIDQIKSPMKSKRSKESRSLKLFKVSLAEFVKEVLKPSWQQGNMSKEAFKTVVKKTVDKVSEAMKSRHIPKSKAKINQYIDSSQLKLTKLVMGYVDKYAKG